MLTTEVENFPGFPTGITGPELMQSFRDQATRFGAEIMTARVSRLDLSASPFGVWVGATDGPPTHRARSIIIATGASSLMLGLEAERRLLGHGLSTCATCDGFFFRDQDICVVGGGDSAIEEALFLSRFARSVTVIHRRETLRASKIMQERAFANDKLRFLWNTVVEDLVGESRLEGVVTRSLTTDERTTHPFTGAFVAIGHRPNTDLFADQLELHDNGYLRTFDDRSHTSVDGVFACGDVQDDWYRQAITAAGSGCAAAIDAERWLERQGH
jgi:thioredoxin reductase (NADPH)